VKKGLVCPKCGSNLNARLVATSKAQFGGHMRTRFCDCHHEIITFERVVDGPPTDATIISGLSGHDKGIVRRIVEALGGSMWR
jgi:hypothetical protein